MDISEFDAQEAIEDFCSQCHAMNLPPLGFNRPINLVMTF